VGKLFPLHLNWNKPFDIIKEFTDEGDNYTISPNGDVGCNPGACSRMQQAAKRLASHIEYPVKTGGNFEE